MERVFSFTTTADFELGVRVGTAAVDDGLQLAQDPDTLTDLWVPNLESGTISRVDADSGAEIARYRTGPFDRDLEPVAVAVDLEGACWVANRAAGSVVKIGRAESGGCSDRDGDGVIETSRDTDGDGDITGDELLDWGADECVLVEVTLVPGHEAAGEPGQDHENYQDTGVRALAVDADNDLWVGVPAGHRFYKLDGATGGLVDVVDLSDLDAEPFAAAVASDGSLWATCWPDSVVLRIDPVDGGDVDVVEMSHGTRGLAQDDERHLFVTGFEDAALSRLDQSTSTVEWSETADWQADGVSVTTGGDVWIAAPGSGRLSRFSRDGEFLGSLPVGNLPTGVAIDHSGKLWVTGSGNDIIVRVDPMTGSADLQKELRATGTHPAIGDLTGIVVRSLTTHYGTWTAVCDNRDERSVWNHVSWQATTAPDASVGVRVRSSEDRHTWSAWEYAANGARLEATPPGRYLEIEVALEDRGAETPPVLDEITVSLAASAEPPAAAFTWSPAEPVTGETVAFVDTSSGSPTGWTWDFGDESVSAEQSPSHVFGRPGTYTISLTVQNDAGSSTTVHEITVSETPAVECAHSWWVPVVVHASGAGESQWRSDVALVGVGPDTAAVELRFHSSAGVRSREVAVDSGGQVDIVDVVDWITQGGSGSGALELCSDAELAVSSRTYDQRSALEPCLAEGTLGQHFAAVDAGSGLVEGSSAVLPQLRENDRFRTNLGLLNLSTDGARVTIVLLDSSGAELARYDVTVLPGRWWQDLRPLHERTGLDHVDAGWARVHVVSGTGISAYASLIDNISNDPTTIPMQVEAPAP